MIKLIFTQSVVLDELSELLETQCSLVGVTYPWILNLPVV